RLRKTPANFGKALLRLIDLGDGDEAKVLAARQRIDVGARHAAGAEAGVKDGFTRLGVKMLAPDEGGGESQGGFEGGAAGDGHGLIPVKKWEGHWFRSGKAQGWPSLGFRRQCFMSPERRRLSHYPSLPAS